ncbi:MAG: helix-turn-helix domain-containing protein [Ruminococcus sp.]|nr:helix-turn-helix domain-containing protein [Ruminococcus sp.]
MLYCEKLTELREGKDLKQNDISKILNIDNSVYGKYEREYILIPTKHLNILSNFYNVSLDYILSFSNFSNYNGNIEEINKKVSGLRLKEFRKENKLTQKSLAEILGTFQQVIANYENGTNIIALPFLYTICKKYNISADYLLGKTDSPKYLK